jgi:hypothetical protein
MKQRMYLPPPGPSRRSFLKRGLFGGALLALGGGAYLAFQPSRRASLPPEGLLVLDADEYAVVAALADRLVPPRAHFPTPDLLRVPFQVDRILVRVDDGAQKELKQLLKLFESGLAGLLFDGRWRPFTQLSEAEQDNVMRAWQGSRLKLRRTGFQALRTLVLAAYYGNPGAWPAVGYPGPPEGFSQPGLPLWKGHGPRPESFGVYHPEAEGG